MSRDRQMGFLWGFLFGVCIVTGATLNPSMFFAAILPLVGCWMFRAE